MTLLEAFFIACGLFGLGYIFLALFTSAGDHPRYLSTSAPLKVGDEPFFTALEGMIHGSFAGGGPTKILNNGDEFFPRLLQTIKKAKETINIMVFIWVKGPLGDSVFDALIAKAQAGIEVRLLLDALGSAVCGQEKVDQLREAGGKVVFFRPVRFGIMHRFHRRNHCRAFIIDGQIGFTGGMAVAGWWGGKAEDTQHWRDFMVEVQGSMAAGLQKVFGSLWVNNTGEVLVGKKFYPDYAVANQSRWIGITSFPAFESHPTRKVFWLTCAAAQKSIHIRSSYFIPGQTLCSVLVERAKAGVDVRILVPQRNNQKLAYFGGRNYYDRLLCAGVKVYEYKPTMTHSKSLVADGVWSLLGSANLDIRSQELNQENMLGIFDADLATRLEADFQQDLTLAQEIDLATWRKRGWGHHLAERCCSLFVEQL